MKTITIRETTYSSFLSLKEKNDSFSDVIDRVLSNRSHDIRPFAGGLADSSHLEELSSLTSSIRKSGRSRG